MRKAVKRFVSSLLILSLLLTGFGMLSVNAVTAYEILDKLAVVDSNGVQGTYGNLKPGSSYTNGQCWQYVKDLSTYVFGQTMYIPNTASYLSGNDDEYYNVRQPVKNCGYDSIVNLLKLAQPGDLICLRNSKVDQTYGHIMFVGRVTTTQITVYQAASGKARKDTVNLTVTGLQNLYSFGYEGQASFYESNYGVALFRSIKRTGQSDYSYGDPVQLFTTSGIVLPSGKITQGQDFNVSGMIYCQKKIAWVGLAIVDLSTNQHIFETPANWPQTYSYDISGLNSMIDFGTLSPGRYRALLKAGTGEDEYMNNIPSDFEVVSNDTTAPQITSYGINQTDAYSYVVWCCFADNVGVTSVQFPTWTANGGQDDLIWYNGGFEPDGKTACVRVWFKDHNNELGDYISHIYVYDAAGNCSQVGTSTLVERNAPDITSTTITDRTTDGYTISCTIEDENKIKSVLFPTWTVENGQDDIVWHAGTVNGNTASCRINVSDHNNEHGRYHTHVYAYDIWDNQSHIGDACWVPSNEEMRTVTFDANGGNNPPTAQSGYVNSYDSIAIPNTKPARTGYEFVGWAAKATATAAQYQPGEPIKPEKDITLFAVWKQTVFTLTYNANGGNSAPSKQTGNGQIKLSHSAPTRSGYTFLGWATSSGATAAQYQPGDSFSLTKDTTLYAVWKKDETPTVFTLTYNANGGNGAPAKQTGNGQITLSHSAPTRSGYTFLGWATSSTATAAQYQPGDSFSLTKDTTLYAVWQKNGTAPSQGMVKSVSVDDVTVNWKSSATIKPNIDADDGVKTTVTYSSSDTSVASVNEKTGEVYGAKRGTATITCTVTDEAGNTVKDTCKVTVKYTFVQWLIKIFLLGFIWYK